MNANGRRLGGFNALRLVSKRCRRVVETVATRLTMPSDALIDDISLPVAALKRCKGIEHFRSYKLFSCIQSLDGCPSGLKSLVVRSGCLLTCLEPLSACMDLEILEIDNYHRYRARITDLSPR